MQKHVPDKKRQHEDAINAIAGGVSGAASKTATAPLARLTILYQVQSFNRAAQSSAAAQPPPPAGSLDHLPIRVPSPPPTTQHSPNTPPSSSSQGGGTQPSAHAPRQSAHPSTTVPPHPYLTRAAPPPKPPGLARALRDLVASEGLAALWRGNLATIIHRLPYSATNFAVFEAANKGLVPYVHNDVGRRLTAGATSGLVACTVAYPLDLVRTRLSAQRGATNGGAVHSAMPHDLPPPAAPYHLPLRRSSRGGAHNAGPAQAHSGSSGSSGSSSNSSGSGSSSSSGSGSSSSRCGEGKGISCSNQGRGWSHHAASARAPQQQLRTQLPHFVLLPPREQHPASAHSIVPAQPNPHQNTPCTHNTHAWPRHPHQHSQQGFANGSSQQRLTNYTTRLQPELHGSNRCNLLHHQHHLQSLQGFSWHPLNQHHPLFVDTHHHHLPHQHLQHARTSQNSSSHSGVQSTSRSTGHHSSSSSSSSRRHNSSHRSINTTPRTLSLPHSLPRAAPSPPLSHALNPTAPPTNFFPSTTRLPPLPPLPTIAHTLHSAKPTLPSASPTLPTPCTATTPTTFTSAFPTTFSTAFSTAAASSGHAPSPPSLTQKLHAQPQPPPAPPRYRGIVHALCLIVQQEGVFGLYRGLGATLAQVTPALALNFALYDSFKELWLKHASQANSSVSHSSSNTTNTNTNTNKTNTSSRSSTASAPPPPHMTTPHMTTTSSLTCGAAAGFCASTLTFPLDVIRRRVQVSHHGSAKAHGGATSEYLSVWRQVYSTSGLRGFYAGIVTEYAKVLPGMAIAFTVYEGMKELLQGLVPKDE